MNISWEIQFLSVSQDCCKETWIYSKIDCTCGNKKNQNGHSREQGNEKRGDERQKRGKWNFVAMLNDMTLIESILKGKNQRKFNSNTSRKIPSRGEQTAVWESVWPGWETESVGDHCNQPPLWNDAYLIVTKDTILVVSGNVLGSGNTLYTAVPTKVSRHLLWCLLKMDTGKIHCCDLHYEEVCKDNILWVRLQESQFFWW